MVGEEFGDDLPKILARAAFLKWQHEHPSRRGPIEEGAASRAFGTTNPARYLAVRPEEGHLLQRTLDVGLVVVSDGLHKANAESRHLKCHRFAGAL